MFKALLIKWAIDSALELIVEALNKKVKDTSSKVDNKIAKVVSDEKEAIKVEVLDLVKRKVK